MSEKERYEKLALKWLEGTITAAEKAEFAAWYNSHDDGNTMLPASLAGHEDELEARIYVRIKQLVQQSEPVNAPKMNRLWMFTAAAALLLMCFSVGLYLWQYHGNRTEQLSYDVKPGSNKATLTLTDGRVVELSGARSGIIVADGGIRYRNGEQLIDSEGTGSDEIVTMTTPKGGRYQVTLSDGTTVWLNSASTLRYPHQFTRGTRVVELEGEGYFEVFKDGKHPFVVKCNGQEVQILGTAFNINSYTDEEGIKTTLVEGKVRLRNEQLASKSQILQPGQQALLQGSEFIITQVDTQEVTAWKDGYFQFNDTDMHTVMKRFARWYDIEVTYENTPSNLRFGGRIPMDMSLGSVLKVLAATGVDYEIKKDRQLVVKGR